MFLLEKEEFGKLPMDEKLIQLACYGDYITWRVHKGMMISLYNYSNYFVEVWKNKNNQEVEWIALANEDVVNAYVADLDLRGLFPVA